MCCCKDHRNIVVAIFGCSWFAMDAINDCMQDLPWISCKLSREDAEKFLLRNRSPNPENSSDSCEFFVYFAVCVQGLISPFVVVVLLSLFAPALHVQLAPTRPAPSWRRAW